MSVKLALLKSGETVISEAKELISDDTVCGYLFENPHLVYAEKAFLLSEENSKPDTELTVTMTPWIALSSDTKIPVRPDWIVTVVEPVDVVKEMYLEKINGKDDQSFVAE